MCERIEHLGTKNKTKIIHAHLQRFLHRPQEVIMRKTGNHEIIHWERGRITKKGDPYTMENQESTTCLKLRENQNTRECSCPSLTLPGYQELHDKQ